MNISNICSELFSGKSLAIAFPNEVAAKTFRTRLYAEKKKQEMALSVLGMDVPRQQVSFKVAVDSVGAAVVTIKLIDPPEPMTYKVLSIDSEPPNENV